MNSSADTLAAELDLSDADNVLPGIVIESALFGILTLLISVSTITLFRQGIRHSRPRQFMLTASLVMYIASGTHWVLNVHAAMKELRDVRTGTPSLQIHTLYVWSEIGSIALFFNFWISDMVVMWRACCLWGWCRHLKITVAAFVIIPAVLSIVDVSITHPTATQTDFTPDLFGLVALLVSLISNVWATSLIGYKAWIARNELRALWGRNGHTPAAQCHGILLLLAESGFLYSIVWVTFIVSTAYTTIKGSTPITHAISAFMPSFVGLYPTIIVVLVSLRMTHLKEHPDQNASYDNNRQVLSTLVIDRLNSPEIQTYASRGANDLVFAGAGSEECLEKYPSDHTASVGSSPV